ncbi:MAG: hypothetical protein KDC87_16560 [Planctomycetes bacterium]|nr:hypothetical protein [Planctomycetota bacterium]
MASSRVLPTLILFAAALPAQATFTKLAPATSPTARSDPGMAWSLHENRAILFGGHSATASLSDTWAWNGTTWAQLSPTTVPPAREAQRLAYDLIQQKTVMFSGWNGSVYLADTWVWSGTDWQNVTPTTQPPERDWAQMAFDVGSLKVLLFGGHDYRRHSGSNPPGAYGDTWTFDVKTSTWTQLTPTTDPGKRFGGVMAYDKGRGKVIMLGGATPGTNYNDMWEWSGTDWVQLTPKTLPGARSFATMVYDDLRQVMVLYGGYNATLLTDVWEWDGVDWTQRTTTTQPGADFCGAVYDPTRQETVVYGGRINHVKTTPSGDTWSYGSATPASYDAFGSGCAGTAGTPTLSGTLPWLGETLTVTVQNLPAGKPTFLYLSLSNTSWGSIPLPLDLSFLGAPGCNLRVAPLFQFPIGNTNGTATWVVPLPTTTSLAGLPFYNQAYAADPTANAAGLVVSNGGAGKAGLK